MNEFKVGDKVRYKESEFSQCENNGHVISKTYTIAAIDSSDNFAYFNHDGGDGTYSYRLELAEPKEETFDYKQALKILAENPEIELEYKFKGRDFWSSTKTGNVLYLNTTQDVVFQIKPSPKPTFHWLIKAKGKFAVTSGKYASEEDVKAKYSYPVVVIQKLED